LRSSPAIRHCEERSDEAIQERRRVALDCRGDFVATQRRDLAEAVLKQENLE
jgi:hypothetical protein